MNFWLHLLTSLCSVISMCLSEIGAELRRSERTGVIMVCNCRQANAAHQDFSCWQRLGGPGPTLTAASRPKPTVTPLCFIIVELFRVGEAKSLRRVRVGSHRIHLAPSPVYRSAVRLQPTCVL